MSSAVVYFFHALDFLCVCVFVSLITCATLWDGAIFIVQCKKKIVNVVNFYCSMQEKNCECC
jgi:hypothetical protein